VTADDYHCERDRTDDNGVFRKSATLIFGDDHFGYSVMRMKGERREARGELVAPP